MLGLLFQKRLVAVAVFIPPSIVAPIQSETRSAALRLFAIERQLLRRHARFKRVKSVVGQDLAGQTRQFISVGRSSFPRPACSCQLAGQPVPGVRVYHGAMNSVVPSSGRHAEGLQVQGRVGNCGGEIGRSFVASSPARSA